MHYIYTIYIYIYIIYIYVYIYILYIYIYNFVQKRTGLQVIRFLCKPSFTKLCSFLKYGGIFSPKRATRKSFNGESFGGKFMGREIIFQ